ncbi:unnamed protein product [Cylindrotheca closterium]|uniref:Tetratricopeptide repeat protein n=1 Tax=Cylindrotheca closterium TaxID=2856 RepID=A0AAD2FJV5_9STRA|nr:unnamed protein product [Cylindrotheca closterium]
MTDEASESSEALLKTKVDEYYELCGLFREKINAHEKMKKELKLFAKQCRDTAIFLRLGGLRKEGNRLLEVMSDMNKYLESGLMPEKIYDEFLPVSKPEQIDVEPNTDISTVAHTAAIETNDGLWYEDDEIVPSDDLDSIAEMRNKGNFDLAANSLGRIVEKNPTDSTKFRLTLGNVYRAAGKLEYALAQYNEAIWSGTLSNQEESEARRQMGTIYRNLGSYEEARNSFEKAVVLLDEDQHLDKAGVYNDLAMWNWRLGKFEMMEVDINNSMKAIGGNVGLREHMRAIDGLQMFMDPVVKETSMDATFKAIEEKIKANEGLCNAVLELGESGVVPNAYNNQGLLELERFEYGKAAACFKKSYIIRKLKHGGEAPVIAYAWMNFGKVFDIQAMYEQALHCYQKANAIFEQRLKPDHLLCGEMNNIQGILCMICKKLDLAKQNFDTALEIYSKHLAEGDHKDWIILGAAAAQSENDPAPAFPTSGLQDKPNWLTKIEQSSSMVYETSCGRDTPSLANLYNNMGNMMISMGYHHDADVYYRKSLHIKNSTLQHDNHPSKVFTRHNMKVTRQERIPKSRIVV